MTDEKRSKILAHWNEVLAELVKEGYTNWRVGIREGADPHGFLVNTASSGVTIEQTADFYWVRIREWDSRERSFDMAETALEALKIAIGKTEIAVENERRRIERLTGEQR